MKLKNSHILLIVMTLFLLVSIGSVCASENATDADMQLADDGSDVVLADEDATTFTAKEKIKTEIVSQDVKIKENATQKIDVTVKDNESKAIKITNKNLTVTEGTAKLNFTYKNSAITLSNPLAKGKHTLNITYLGNDVYKNSTKKIVLSVFGDYTLDLKSTTYVNPNTTKVEVPIKVTNGVDNKKPSKDKAISSPFSDFGKFPSTKKILSNSLRQFVMFFTSSAVGFASCQFFSHNTIKSL